MTPRGLTTPAPGSAGAGGGQPPDSVAGALPYTRPVELSAEQRAFLERNRSAAMIALRRDGTPHAVRVGIALVNGQIWSSGTQARLRTRLLRRDPRCTLFVFESGYGFLTLEGSVTILDGPDVPDLSVRLFRAMQAGMRPAPAPGNLMWYGRELDARPVPRGHGRGAAADLPARRAAPTGRPRARSSRPPHAGARCKPPSGPAGSPAPPRPGRSRAGLDIRSPEGWPTRSPAPRSRSC